MKMRRYQALCKGTQNNPGLQTFAPEDVFWAAFVRGAVIALLSLMGCSAPCFGRRPLVDRLQQDALLGLD